MLKKLLSGKGIIAAIASLVLFGTAVPVSAKDQVEVVNNVGMGNVSIALISQQYDPQTKKNIPWQQERIVVPGEKVSEIVTIRNEGEPAWIRAKVEFKTNANVNLSEDDATFAKGWIRKSDGYWYWPHEVQTGDSVKWMECIDIPTEWRTDQVAKTKFHANIKADAVQTRHFKPDFNSNDPWYGTVIETSLYNYTRDDKSTQIGYFVFFEGGAEGLFHKGDDFFSNWTTLMPGDELEDTVSVKNNYIQKVKLFFRIENPEMAELEKACNLQIFRGTEKIFDGKLADAMNEMVLAVMDPGSEFVLKYKLTVPKELTNKYDLTEGQVKWIFRAEMLGSYEKQKNGKGTGVDNDVTKYIAIGGAMAIMIGGLIFILKKNNEKEEA